MGSGPSAPVDQVAIVDLQAFFAQCAHDEPSHGHAGIESKTREFPMQALAHFERELTLTLHTVFRLCHAARLRQPRSTPAA